MEITFGGLSQLLITLCILLGSLYLTSTGTMTPDRMLELWGMLLAGMGIGYINGRKTTESSS